MPSDHAASPATWDQHRGVELGKFRMQNGRNVFLLRTRTVACSRHNQRGYWILILDLTSSRTAQSMLGSGNETGYHRGIVMISRKYWFTARIMDGWGCRARGRGLVYAVAFGLLLAGPFLLSISRAHRVSALHVGRSVGPCLYLLDERRSARLGGGGERPQKLFWTCSIDPPGKAWMHCPGGESDSIASRPRLRPLRRTARFE